MSAALDPATRRLVGAVALGLGFQFHLVVCQSSRQVAQLLAAIAEVVPGLRRGPVRCERFAPYESLPRDAATSALNSDQLSAAVLAWIDGIAPSAADELLVVALDAAPAGDIDAAAWRRLFRRMNEQRNALAKRLDGALLLCLPKWLETAFAHEATDFWSIRSISVTLAADAPSASLADRPGNDLVTRAEIERYRLPDATPSAEEIAEAEAAVRSEPLDWRPQRWLMILLGRRGDADTLYSNLPAALASFDKALAIAETLAARDPANTQWQRDLSVSHDRIGDVLRAQGDGAGALAAYRQSLAIRETLAARDPANTEWQRDLSVSHDRIGDVLLAQGDGAGALAAYRQSLAIRETLAARDPANTQWQRDLIVSNVKLQEASGEPSYAQQALSIALAMQRQGTLQPVDAWMIEELKQRAEATD